MTPDGGRARDAGRRFGEDVVEAMLWSAVEDALLERSPAEAAEFLAGIEAWGAELLGRWRAEVAGFLEAFDEDQQAGRLDLIRRLASPAPTSRVSPRAPTRGPLRALVALQSA